MQDHPTPMPTGLSRLAWDLLADEMLERQYEAECERQQELAAAEIGPALDYEAAS